MLLKRLFYFIFLCFYFWSLFEYHNLYFSGSYFRDTSMNSLPSFQMTNIIGKYFIKTRDCSHLLYFWFIIYTEQFDN